MIFTESGLSVVVTESPIDFWHGWYHDSELESVSISPESRFALLTFIEAAKCAISKAKVGWEGDVRDCYFAKVNGQFPKKLADYVVAIKQGNNGTTFLVFASNPPIDLSQCGYSAPIFARCVDHEGLFVLDVDPMTGMSFRDFLEDKYMPKKSEKAGGK